jgi:hypothetical protein
MGAGVAPMGGFRMPMGAKIGLVVGGLGALVGIAAAANAVFRTSGLGTPSAVCTKAAQCCRKVSGAASSACDNYTRTTGSIADTVCEEALKGYRHSGHCK